MGKLEQSILDGLIKVFSKLKIREKTTNQIYLNWLNKDGGIYNQFYDQKKVIFIHTPKTAGTSISHALYQGDPWHFSAKELRLINRKKFDGYFKFSVVRNPLSRLFSTYNYAFKWIEIQPNTSVKFVTKYHTFEEFILNGLNQNIIKNHYFFWPYFDYLSINGSDLSTDFCGKFENINRDFEIICNILGLNVQLPMKNMGLKRDYKEYYTLKMKKKVARLYKKDFSFFGYEI